MPSDLAGLMRPYANSLSWRNRLARCAWLLVWSLLFRTSPSFMHWWRNLLLRCFGADLGRGVRVYPSCRVWAPWNLTMGVGSGFAFDVECYNVAPVRIGSYVTVSQHALLCTASHDIHRRDRRLVTRPIVIEDAAWVFARAFIGPGVTIATGAVVAACAVVVKDVEPWTVVGGNPARRIGQRTFADDKADHG
jgi:putative colanic acid biosynthesis acetyltransferase WcaF